MICFWYSFLPVCVFGDGERAKNVADQPMALHLSGVGDSRRSPPFLVCAPQLISTSPCLILLVQRVAESHFKDSSKHKIDGKPTCPPNSLSARRNAHHVPGISFFPSPPSKLPRGAPADGSLMNLGAAPGPGCKQASRLKSRWSEAAATPGQTYSVQMPLPILSICVCPARETAFRSAWPCQDGCFPLPPQVIVAGWGGAEGRPPPILFPFQSCSCRS